MDTKQIVFTKKSKKELALEGLDENSLAYHAICSLWERFENKTKRMPSINFEQSLFVADILNKVQKEQSKDIFSERYNFSVNKDKFQGLADLAYKESQNYLVFIHKSQHNGSCNEQTITNYIININIPEHLFGFSKEFYIGLIVTITLYLLSARASKKDKQDILKAIKTSSKKKLENK